MCYVDQMCFEVEQGFRVDGDMATPIVIGNVINYRQGFGIKCDMLFLGKKTSTWKKHSTSH